jgi:hypothetical protein
VSKCVLVVLSNPVEGREDEFNDWYTNRHVADVIKTPGFLNGQRFKIAHEDPSGTLHYKYLATYEFEADDPAVPMEALNARAGTPAMMISDAFDLKGASVTSWVAVTDKITNQ